MQKKFLISIALLSVVLAFSCSYSFANTNVINTVGDGVKNVTSNAGNAINQGATTVRNAVGNAENGMANAASGVLGGTNTNKGNTTVMGRNNNNYTAARTATNDVTFLGMTANAWTWLIMAILAVAIVALVWFYSKQHSDSYSNSSHE